MKNLIRALFSLVKSCFKYFTLFFPNKNVVLIIRTDNIGDYILFRNYLKILRGAKNYADKKIVLLGNENWRDLAEHFDKDVIDSFFWVNKKHFYSSILYKITIILKLRFLRAFEIINCVHSRDKFIDDLVLFSGAHSRITCEGDDVNNYKEKTRKSVFNKEIKSSPNTTFEFFRNKAFFENLTQSKIDIKKTFFNLDKTSFRNTQIAIFPSAAEVQRRWLPLHFAEVINLLHQYNTDFKFLILGSQEDATIAKGIIDGVANKSIINDLCGKTTLVELVDILNESRLLISNETSAVHFAAALELPAVCIANGERFMRFSPYPLSITGKIITIFPDNSFYDAKNKEIYAEKFKYQSEININQITPKQVLEKVLLIIKE